MDPSNTHPLLREHCRGLETLLLYLLESDYLQKIVKSNYHKQGSVEGEVDPFDDFSKFGLVEGSLLDSGDYERWISYFL